MAKSGGPGCRLSSSFWSLRFKLCQLFHQPRSLRLATTSDYQNVDAFRRRAVSKCNSRIIMCFDMDHSHSYGTRTINLPRNSYS
eukprot:scaffold250409_cov23-Prasinocladus_malaysianus.AAC.1